MPGSPTDPPGRSLQRADQSRSARQPKRPGGTGTSRPRVPPRRNLDFAHLDLGALRRYRLALTAEEHRVSYWRRIIQGRLDVVRAGGSEDGLGLDTLRPVLSQASAVGGRRALVQVLPAPAFPPLPDLEQLWDRCPAPADRAGLARLAHDLEQAERELSDYRTAVHRRLDAATTELIARYCEDPAQCMAALPQPPGQPPGPPPGPSRPQGRSHLDRPGRSA